MFHFQLHQRFSDWWKSAFGWVFLRQIHLTEYGADRDRIKQHILKQGKKAVTGEEHIFVAGYRGQYMTVFMAWTLVTEEACPIWVRVSILKTVGTGAVLIRDRLHCAPHNQKIGVRCAITTAQIAGPCFLKILSYCLRAGVRHFEDLLWLRVF